MSSFFRYVCYGLTALVTTFIFFTFCANGEDKKNKKTSSALFSWITSENVPDTTELPAFFSTHRQLQHVARSVQDVYRKELKSYWFSNDSLIPAGRELINSYLAIETEGVGKGPYMHKANGILFSPVYSVENEFFLTAIYFYYCQHVLEGFSAEKIKLSKWLIPRPSRDYAGLLAHFLTKPKLLQSDTLLVKQYYWLRKSLAKYRRIVDQGGWKNITFPVAGNIKFGKKHRIVPYVRKRLAKEGYVLDTISDQFSKDLLTAVSDYQQQHQQQIDSLISQNLVSSLNIPATARLKTIQLNMERCRWLSDAINQEAIFVNVPAFMLWYHVNGNSIFDSRVVVGKLRSKTEIFSGEMADVVFLPYWYIPRSILVSEVFPGMKRNPNYLSARSMEWVGGRVRQRPGRSNALGLVKFLFPNGYNIYLHDSPQKKLYSKTVRAFSHGCVRVEKARELAITVMQRDRNWTVKEVDTILKGRSQRSFKLNKKIPVYIAYLTAMADSTGTVAFYSDIYNRDTKLDSLFNSLPAAY